MNIVEPAPLAAVSVCRNLPEMRAPMEAAVEREVRTGTVWDQRFVIREIISRSRQSTIYRGEDIEEGHRSVAIKVPLLVVESDPVGFARFIREEEIGTKLDHPGLLRFLRVTEKTGRPHFVTEFLDGCTLADVLREHRPLPESDALRIAGVACAALQRLHDLGYVHRDLKPANIVLCRDLTLRVIDFGQAAPPERRRSLIATLTPVVGTPEYMAPEQVSHGPSDERTDVYAMGAVLYQMLTGVPPFQDEDAWRSAYRRMTGDPVAPRSLNPALSPEAEEIVLRAMQQEPAARYQSMAALASELEAPSRVRVTGLADQLRAPRWRLSFHGTPLLAGTLLGLGVVLGLVALFCTLVALKGRP